MSQLRIEPLLPAIGAVIHQTDLSRPLDSVMKAQIEEALVKYQVLFFRNQHITPQQQRDFASLFGPLITSPLFPHVTDVPEIRVVERGPDRKPDDDEWHTDSTFIEKPPLGCVLYARVIPPVGGDTLWSSMYSLYERLSPSMQQFLSTLSAEHSIAKTFDYTGLIPKEILRLDKLKEEYPPIIHPIVRTHPISMRKCVFVNYSYTTRIVELNSLESKIILTYLFDLVHKPEYTVRWKWMENDIAFWDNRSTQHYAVGDYWPNCRRMERAAIMGDKPF